MFRPADQIRSPFYGFPIDAADPPLLPSGHIAKEPLKMTIALRSYSDADLEPCMLVWRRSSEHAHSFLGKTELDADARLVRTLYIPNADITVAALDGRVVGFIALAGTFVGGLFVDPTVHRQGIGRRLLHHAESRSGPLTLEVYAANRDARAFYRALGYREILSRTVDDSGRPYPLVRMTSENDAGVVQAAPTVNIARATIVPTPRR